ncbi:CPBP family intramembrane glutamic endopeptidase [Qipengyuania oceanensis]|nr:CPBP family intramembrane glutamic endopeptidase [Qipengyuania oceanensis]
MPPESGLEKIVLGKPARAILVALFFAGALAAPIPFPFKVPIIAAIALIWIWIEDRGLAPVGLTLPRRPGSTMLWAAGGALGATLIIGELILPLIERVFSIETDHAAYGPLRGNEQAALRLWAYAMFSAAVAEEIIYRGFLLHQLSRIVRQGNAGRWAAILVGAMAFAIPHYAQGPVGLASVFLVGVLFGWIFFRSDRNLWSLFLAHALVDTWGIYSLYRGW